ncbi:Cytochrome c oxidase subunit 6 [Mitosporidium daphniae]|uniref:Cytochrome c oxidase subunit 6, mitochondrial n=1 Tax=Mitosporidium daphniae TaxID=1485682 RepID=A0A098VPR1_9MICR|nr:putative subunit Va of cytochrome c oxidase [Mitosporidium daphniae]KGG50935.1 putative subunit Va of cytochrome c oxidase [Mitosporidium daphniae]|eukprot:XP_013237362.1 putative subunit Va of cytochrome c oxidase [Mitosporidium daphniae]
MISNLKSLLKINPPRQFLFAERILKKSLAPPFACSNSYSSSRELDTVEAYEREWVDFFKTAPDQFELYRGLNNAFSYDIVPTVPIVREVLLACRRLNHLPTAIRLLAALRAKVDTVDQYKLYLTAIEDLRLELGVPAPEEIGV